MTRYFLIVLLLVLSSCQRDKITSRYSLKKEQPPLFELVPSDSTGITFANNLIYSGPDNFSSVTRQWYGGGVTVGDVNNDGLIDIFFTSNQGKSRLYLNLGNFHFKDITDIAGIDTRGGWTTGAVMADVNGDGLMDIYVCRGGMNPSNITHNLLYINQGNLTFRQSAAEFGLDDNGLTTSASFFDYDNDGDLDLYTMNYPITKGDEDPLNFSFYQTKPIDSVISDKLFENINGRFKNVSEKAHIPIEKGSGLGLVISDINMDGWPDIYVDNDWMQSDYCYINQKDKTFRDEEPLLFTKNSLFSMGCDIADVNNDGMPDIITLDMAPTTHVRINTHDTQLPIDYYFMEHEYGKLLQYNRNFLQINNGNHTKFSERGEMSGIARTDWGWSALWGDFDNDGWKDLFITKGMWKDIGDRDFDNLMLTYGNKTEYKHTKESSFQQIRKYLHANYIFKNLNGFDFAPRASEWGIDQLVNSQGAAYADLNNDGKLDLIVNNIDATASIYRNTGGGTNNHYLRISISGEKSNKNGLGTKAWIYNKGKIQYAELTNARGFQSSSEPVLHFGLGRDTIIDSILVVFNSFKYTVIKNVKSDQHIRVLESEAKGSHFDYQKKIKTNCLVEEKTQQIKPAFIHRENDFNDFKRDKLIPRMFSKEGPALAVGDLNGDGLEDFYIGGAADQTGAVYLQQTDGSFLFKREMDIITDSASEDVAAIIDDLNGDGRNDLYVVSGSNEFEGNDKRYQDRIYLNAGNGTLKRCYDCLPVLTSSKSCVAA